MQKKYDKISINSYLAFSELLEEYRGTHEENRIYALKHKSLLKNPKKMLLNWGETHRLKAIKVSKSIYEKEKIDSI